MNEKKKKGNAKQEDIYGTFMSVHCLVLESLQELPAALKYS